MYPFPQTSTLPAYYPSRATGCTPVGLGEALFSPGLSGLRLASNPQCAGLGMIRPGSPDGLGQTDRNGGRFAYGAGVGAGVVVAVGVGLLLVAGYLSYQAGKAMAPNRTKANTWGWIGVPVGLFTGAPGLGVMGWISNAQR
jgi:hypothetical protein